MTANKKVAGVFVDLSNLYYCVKKKYPGRKINYEHYLNRVKEQYNVYRAFAYGKVFNNSNNDAFITCLKFYGYEPKFRSLHMYSTWDVGMTLDIIRIIDKLDVIVVGSSSRELSCIQEYAKSKGVQVHVLACGVPIELKGNCDHWQEVDESLLENEPEIINHEIPITT